MKFFPKTRKKVKRIVGYDEVKGNAQFIAGLAKQIISLLGVARKNTKSKPIHSFTELGYTKEELSQKREIFKKFFFFYFLATLLALLYAIFLFVQNEYRVGILALCFMLLCLSQAFRYHFWLFQLKRDRPGSGLKEWFFYLFKK